MSKRIMIIEDDQDVIDTLLMVLKMNKYEVDVAYDGRQGVQKIKQNKPDLLILDLTMPVMDGWAVMIAVKKDPVYSTIPIMVVTSSKEMQHIEKARKLGVQSYCVKPFEPQKIVKIINRLLSDQDSEEGEKYSGLMDGDMISRDGK